MEQQIEKLKAELENQKEYEQMLEDQIKENDEQIDKQKKELEKKDQEITKLKKDLSEANKKADVFSNTDDVGGAKIIQLEVEIHDLQSNITELNQQIQKLTQELNNKNEESEMEMELLKEEHQKQIDEQIQQINTLKKAFDDLQKQKEQSETNLKEQIANLQSNDSDMLLEEIDKLTKQIEEQAELIMKKDKQIEDLQLNGVKKEGIEEIGKQDRSEEIKELEEKVSQLEEVLLQYQEENQQFIQKEEEYKKEKESLTQQLAQQQKEFQEMNEKLLQVQEQGNVADQFEELKLEYEELVEEYTQTNDKLGEAEQENKLLNSKCQEYLEIKGQQENKITQLEENLKHQNEIMDENNELKQLIKQTQEQVNNLQSNNEYQTLFLQLRDEYEDYKDHVTTTINDKDQQLYQAAQFIQELEAFKEQSQLLEENNNLLTNQLQTQQENNLKYQQRIEELEKNLNNLQNQYQDINDIQLKLKQIKEENEDLKTKNYEQDEIIKNYEIQLDSLRQIECDSPKKISKLQQENTETTAEYTKLKEATQREIHLLKQEKQQLQCELQDLKLMLDTYINQEETFESKIQYISDYWGKLLAISDEQTNLVEKFQMEIQELNENIGQIQSIQNLSTEQQLINQDTEQINFSNEKIITQDEPNQFSLHVQKVSQVEYDEQCIQTEEIVEQIQIRRAETFEQSTNTENRFNNNEEEVENILIDKQEQEIQTDVIQDQDQEKETINQIIQTDSLVMLEKCEQQNEIKQQDDIQQENEQENEIKQQNDIQQENEEQNIQQNQDFENTKEQEHDQSIINKLMQPQSCQEADCNTSLDFVMIESLKKKVEDLDNLRKSLEKEINQLKDKNKKQEEKIQNLQKPGTPRRQSDAKDDRKKQQDNELITRLQKQIKELQEELEQTKTHNLNEQIEQQSNELEQLQQELDSYKDQLIKQKQSTIKYKTQLDKIYSLGPNALNQLQSEPKKEFQPSFSQQMEKFQIQSFLYIKSQRTFQCQFIEIIRKQLRVYQNLKGKIEKSMFDSYIFDEIFFDTQKMFQYLDQQKLKLINDTSKVYLILGQSKTHKKLIMIMLIELINNLIQKQQLTQKIQICYQERIGKQWIEIEQFNLQTQSLQDLECAICGIKTHLLTKQNATGEKIRKLVIQYQSFIDNEVSSTSQFIIATCPSLPPGDFKGITQKILNISINQNMQFYIFLHISPSLQHYQKTSEILVMAKMIKQVKGQLDITSLTSSKSVSEYNLVDDESQKQIRIINNKLILKNQEVDQMKKIFDNQLKQLHDLQIKFDVQATYQNSTQTIINNIILEIKQKINLKMNQKKNKKSQTIAFLDKLAIQLDQIARKQSYSIVSPENNEKYLKSKASEIINPFI